MPSHATQRRSERELEPLVRDIRANDDGAWLELVERFDRMLRTVARSYRLSSADVDDVLQTVWLRLFEQRDRLRDPNAIAGWLTTTTRRASLDVLQRQVREQLTDDPEMFQGVEVDDAGEELLVAERESILWRALGTLPDHQRRLMVLMASTPTDYRKISATLDIPVGSIGPTRARSLARLRRHAELRQLHLVSS